MGKQVAARIKQKELVLPVIRGFKRLRFLMTDKVSVKTDCTLKTSYRKEILNKIIS